MKGLSCLLGCGVIQQCLGANNLGGWMRPGLVRQRAPISFVHRPGGPKVQRTIGRDCPLCVWSGVGVSMTEGICHLRSQAAPFPLHRSLYHYT
eukprot:3431449-Amphidinium_carterae.1